MARFTVQKSARPRTGHKEICGAPGDTKRLHKLARNLVLCPPLLIQLQSCCILAFDLFQRARCDEFLSASVDVAVEPAEIADFANTFWGKGSAKKDVGGMLQVNRFTPVTEVDTYGAEFWRRERAKEDTAGFHADP
ncbi:hypothetical protein C8R45DRAFT_1098977 [Mycena sanguinolenta]|nr:hypothetical protein C8R45DRAFT_1098977 [Mycena sanguinolenta]